MYQEEKNVSIVKIILRIILFILIFILVYKLISLIINNSKKNKEDTVFNDNINLLKDTGVKYAQDKNFNLNVGETKKISLKEFNNSNLVQEIKDKDNQPCSKEESYVEISRLENEYKIKVYLLCGTEDKDIYTYLDPETREEQKDKEPNTNTTSTTTTTTTTTTTSTTTTKSTTKKTTVKTTKAPSPAPDPQPVDENYYTVGFNTNGGQFMDSIKVKKGETIKLPTPVKEGYTFYRWEDSSQNAYTDTITPNKNMVLIAKWR